MDGNGNAAHLSLPGHTVSPAVVQTDRQTWGGGWRGRKGTEVTETTSKTVEINQTLVAPRSK